MITHSFNQQLFFSVLWPRCRIYRKKNYRPGLTAPTGKMAPHVARGRTPQCHHRGGCASAQGDGWGPLGHTLSATPGLYFKHSTIGLQSASDGPGPTLKHVRFARWLFSSIWATASCFQDGGPQRKTCFTRRQQSGTHCWVEEPKSSSPVAQSREAQRSFPCLHVTPLPDQLDSFPKNVQAIDLRTESSIDV